MQTQITVKQTWPPKDPSWSNGAIVDTNDTRYSVPKETVSRFQIGQTYNIDYSVGTTRNGNQFNKIEAVNGQPLKASNGNWQAPIQQPAQRPPQAPDAKEKGMFIMSCVGRAMGSGQFKPADIPELVQFALDGWRVYCNGGRQTQAGGPPASPPASENDYGFSPNEEPPF